MKRNAKVWYISKTVWLNVLAIMAVALPELGALPELASHKALILTSVAIINIFLRTITDQAIAATKPRERML